MCLGDRPYQTLGPVKGLRPLVLISHRLLCGQVKRLGDLSLALSTEARTALTYMCNL